MDYNSTIATVQGNVQAQQVQITSGQNFVVANSTVGSLLNVHLVRIGPNESATGNNAFFELSNFTTAFSNTTVINNQKDSMPKWLIALIASMVAVAVVGVILLVLIWYLCGKKKPVAPSRRDVENDNADKRQRQKASRNWCPCFGAKADNDQAPDSTVLHSAQLRDGKLNFTKQPPLPPIESKFIVNNQQSGNNYTNGGNSVSSNNETSAAAMNSAVINVEARTPHRRLAPLYQDHVTTMHPTGQGNPYTLHGGQQSFSLRGVPVISVPEDKRRPLPVPPSLG